MPNSLREYGNVVRIALLLLAMFMATVNAHLADQEEKQNGD